MTFSTLENKFNSVATQIYNKFSLSEQQLVVVKPNTPAAESRIKDDSRLLPFVSTVRDTILLTKFLASARGGRFLATQTLLQTGNTFAETRLYNPTSPLIASRSALPLIPRIPRQFGTDGGIGTLIGKPNLDTYRGALQNETVGKLSGNSVLTRIFTQNPVSSVFKALFVKPEQTDYFEDATKEYYIRPEDNAFYRYEVSGKYRNIPLNVTRTFTPAERETPSVTTTSNLQLFYGPRLFPTQPMSQRGTKKVFKTINTKSTTDKTFINQWLNYSAQSTYIPTSEASSETPFKILENKLGTNGYFIGKNLNVKDLSSEIDNAFLAKGAEANVGDPYNATVAISTEADNQITPIIAQLYRNISVQPSSVQAIQQYKNEVDKKTDIIKFTFGLVDERIDPIHFRALLSSLKENVKPEFSEQRYLGRTERFVAYGGAKRTATLAFNIVAFSEMERNQVWKRINFLTGLAYPTGVSTSGFMTPPLFRISVGGIYEDQPCYIDSLNYTFLDESITFDIDAEVPTVVDVDMSIVLLEKRSRYYDSPFYKIVEELV